MKKKDKLLLREVIYYRTNLMFPEAIANMHRLLMKYPNDYSLLYLLASLYYETKEYEVASEYCEEALKINENGKEAAELKGILCMENKEYEEARKMFVHAVEIDSDFYQPRLLLISLLYNHFKDYESVINHSEYFLSRLAEYTKQRKKDRLRLFLMVKNYLFSSYINLTEYSKALDFLLQSLDFMKPKVDYFQGFFYNEETDILKLSLLSRDQDKIEFWKNYFVTTYKVNEIYFENVGKEAEQKNFNTII